MPARIHAFVLIAVLLLQSLVMLGTAAVHQRAGELTHLAVHGQSLEHHHHADRDLHMGEDDSKDAATPSGSAAQHQHTDSGITPTGLLVSRQLVWAATASQSPEEAYLATWLSPTLDGPLRPPKPLG